MSEEHVKAEMGMDFYRCAAVLAAALDVRQHTALQLVQAGLDTPERVRAASDAELLAVPTVGRWTLKHLRGHRRLGLHWNGGGGDETYQEVEA